MWSSKSQTRDQELKPHIGCRAHKKNEKRIYVLKVERPKFKSQVYLALGKLLTFFEPQSPNL